jgi:hypothetical protein
MNFIQGVQRVHSESLRSTAAPTTVDTTNDRHLRLVRGYADAWRELQTERDWRWMRTTLDVSLTPGLQIYSGGDLGASDFGRWRPEDDTYSPLVYIDGSPNSRLPIDFMPLDQFRYHYIYTVQGSTFPRAWSIDEGNNLLIGPKPAAAYKLRIEYWRAPTELVADADEPDMPDRFHMLLVWRALRNVGINDAAPEVLTKALQEYQILHGRLLKDQARLPHL